MTLKPTSYLGSPGRPSWSADGSRVAVKLNRQALVVDSDTQEVVRELASEERLVGSPQFHPSRNEIALDMYDRESKKWKIQVSSADGSVPRTVVPHGRTPQWAPDGEKIAYSSYTDDFQTKVSVVNADGSGNRVVSEKPHSKDFSWSPDGRSIAYEGIDHDSGYQLRKVELETGRDTLLSNGSNGEYIDRTPVWSPSGHTIAFERRHKQFPAASLWSVGSEGGLEKQLFQKFSDVVDPVFSPDRESIVFGSNHGGRGGLDLFRMDLDNLEIRQLTDLPGDEHSPSFSPDGHTLAYLNTDRKRPAGETQSLHFHEFSSAKFRSLTTR